MEPGHVAENDAERRRLIGLVKELTPAQMEQPLEGDWTVAAALAHLAFWDRRAKLLVERWQRGHRWNDPEWYADMLNEALLPSWRSLPPAAAVRLALEAAEAVDAKVAALTGEVAASIDAADKPWLLRRFRHRREHLDQIERALGRGSHRQTTVS